MKKKQILTLVVATTVIGLSLVGVTTAEKSYSVLENGEIQICGVSNYIEEYGDSCMIVQDRNLGATTTGVGPDAPATSYGDYYQWGDNTVYTIQNWNSGNIKSGYIWGGDSMSELDAYIAVSTYDRSAMRGPCPEGYHLPIRDEMNALATILTDLDAEDIISLEIDSALQIPYAGYRNASDGSFIGQGEDRGFWYSVPRYSDYDGNTGYSYGWGIATTNRANGLPVRCFKNPGYSSSETGSSTAKIILSVAKGILTIGTETGNLNLGEVNVSNSAQELSGSFGENSFWVEDMKGVESGYYTTISVTDLTGSAAGHVISADNVSLKTAGNEPSNISGATASEAKVIFGEGIKSWHSGSGQVNYFQRLNTATEYAGRVGKWGDNLQIKVNIPAHTPSDIYRGTITYTLYDLDL